MGTADSIIAKLDSNDNGEVTAEELKEFRMKAPSERSFEALELAFASLNVRRASSPHPVTAMDLLEHRTTIDQVLKRKLNTK